MEGTVPLPPGDHRQNNDITVAPYFLCNTSKWAAGTGMGGVASREAEGGSNEREDAWSCGLAELAVNLCRFIFSGACCSLKGGQIYTPLPGPLRRGPGDEISGPGGWVGRGGFTG